jgi:hypothetical protein
MRTFCLYLSGELKEASKVEEITVDNERISISAVAYDNYRVSNTTSSCILHDLIIPTGLSRPMSPSSRWKCAIRPVLYFPIRADTRTLGSSHNKSR